MTLTLPPTDSAPTAATSPLSQPLHLNTPLLHSPTLSARTGHNIYLKLDTDQPSCSFKIRGIGAICQQAIVRHGADTHLVSSSGGNAGLAVAYAASRAGVGCTIYTPLSTEADVVGKLRGMGAEVVVGGESWDAADSAAREQVGRMTGAVYVHPFEGDLLAQGHSSLIGEIYADLDSVDVIISSVGGGGLLRGIIDGIARHTSSPPVLVAVQNFGVNSFNLSFDSHLSSRSTTVVQLAKIDSKCTSMGTKRCSTTTLHTAIEYHAKQNEIITLTVTDALSASACWQFAQTHLDGTNRLVELSCASCLTPVYHPWILERVLDASQLKKRKGLNIVVQVCGGSKVNQELVDGYKRDAGLMSDGDRVRINGVDYPAKH